MRKDVGRLLLYTPVVNPAEFDVAISYLIRRLEENASDENFMSAVFELVDTPALFDREKERFLASLAALGVRQRGASRCRRRTAAGPSVVVPLEPLPGSRHARADHTAGRPTTPTSPPWSSDSPAARSSRSRSVLGGFHNEPDTDPSLAGEPGLGPRDPGPRRGLDARRGHASRRPASTTPTGSTSVIATVTAAAAPPGPRQPGAERAAVLHRAGVALAAHRGRLIEVMAAEAGKTIAEADPEVSEADRLRPLLRRARAATSTAVAGRRVRAVAASPSSPRRGTSRSRSRPAACSPPSPPGSGVIVKPRHSLAQRSRCRAASRRSGRPACRATCSQLVDLARGRRSAAASSRTPTSTA